MNGLEDRLAHHSRDTGIPAAELRRLCIRAGIEQLDKGNLTITAQSPDSSPAVSRAQSGPLKGRPLKEMELRAVARCGVCFRLIGETPMPLFYLVAIERHGIDASAVRRQQGLGMMVGARLANVMGPDEDMTHVLLDPVRLMVCEECSIATPLCVAQLAGLAMESSTASGKEGT